MAHRIEKALVVLFPENFEEVLRKELIQPDMDSKLKLHYLRVLSAIVTAKSADVLFNLISDLDPRVANLAIHCIMDISKDSRVSQKAKDLLKSPDPLKRAMAIKILPEYFKKNLQELSAFSKDEAAEVRREIVKIYAWTNTREELLQYATDIDPKIRNKVFNYIAEKGHICNNGFLVTNTKNHGQCDLCVDAKDIAFNLSDKVIIIPKYITKNHRIINNDQEFTNCNKDEIYGIYFECQQQLDKTEKYLYFYNTPNNLTTLKEIYTHVSQPVII